MRRWLHVMLLKGVFGASAGTVLAAIRKVFLDKEFGDPFVRTDLNGFPSDGIGAILRQMGKDPGVSEEFIDSLLYTQYEDKQAFSILSLLAPYLDYRNGNFHKDHLHPASTFSRKGLIKSGVADSDLDFYLNPDHWNSVLNLAHLDSNENKSKQDRPLIEWAGEEIRRQKGAHKKFCVDHDLPSKPGDLELLRFRRFIEVRRVLLRDRLKAALQQ